MLCRVALTSEVAFVGLCFGRDVCLMSVQGPYQVYGVLQVPFIDAVFARTYNL